ncbi:MAG: Ig-like domain-containing protein [Bellilinea sp.]
MNPTQAMHGRSRKLLTAFSILIVVTLACNLPFMPTPAPGPGASTATPKAKSIKEEPLPPVVVETTPLASGTLPLQGEVTLTFDQPMDRESVEGAVKVDPALPGRFEWDDDSTVRFVPDQTLPPEIRLTVTVADTARSQTGKSLLRAASFNFQTPGALRVTEILPRPGTANANPSATVTVSFNQPVVALGEEDGPPAFTIEPQVDGKGTWLNTSTYIFEADPALGGGVQYRVHLNPDLISLSGAALDDSGALDWEFTTAPPALLVVAPLTSNTLLLDEHFTLTFNQPMDTASVESNFSLRDAVGTVIPGDFAWTERDTVVTFSPSRLLKRGNSYQLQLSNRARSRGGTELLISTQIEYQTVGDFSVRSTEPAQGESLTVYTGLGTILVNFNAPLAEGQNLPQLVELEPAPGNLRITPSGDRKALYLSGSFVEGTGYHLTLRGDLLDRWGGTLGRPYTANFRVANSEPTLQIPILLSGSPVLFTLPGETILPGYAVNLDTVNLARVSLDKQQFLDAYYLTLDVEAFSSVAQWDQVLTLPPNTTQGIEIDLVPGDGALESGLYLYQVGSPEITARYSTDQRFSLVVSPLQVTIKESQAEAFVWVTDLRTGQPAANIPVEVFTSRDKAVGNGTTDAAGISRIAIPKDRETYPGMVVVAGNPETADFGVGISNWTSGISPWQMGVSSQFVQPDLQAYLYSDRPIYQPGQTIYFRGVLRTPDDARYTPAALEKAEFKLLGGYDAITGQSALIDEITLDLSPYGTVSGEFTLPEDAIPGTYTIQLTDHDAWLNLQVAEYRKPEIDVQVDFAKTDFRSGETLEASVNASYYFGGAASNVLVRWSLYVQDDYFRIPGGFSTGLVDTGWLNPFWYGSPEFFMDSYLTGGEGQTGPDGSLKVTFSPTELAEWIDPLAAHTLILQAEMVDESGQTVSRRGSARVHPDDFYIGIRPEAWLAQAGETVGFYIQTSDWQAEPVGDKKLRTVFQRVEWVQDWSNVQTGETTFKEELTEVGSVNLVTDANGQARIEFTVDAPGAYRLDVSGGQALTQVMIWAGGTGSVPWPNLPDQHIRLQSNQQSFQAGDTARIFIPNPFPQGAVALVTVERRGVLRSQVVDIQGSSTTFELDILPEDAPNVYFSVLLLGQTDAGKPDFRMGILELQVAAEALLLDVHLTSQEETLEPGQTARFDVLVTDSAGSPVQGEFSIAVVDKAIFALADPNAPDIISAFYGPQPLGVLTSTALAAYTGRIVTVEPGLGGGGGGGDEAWVADLRRDFQDTAYWSGAFETDANGRAMIEFPLPDNLTTWVATVRGLTRDTRVGEAAAELLVTKDLIIRPVTPRFLVAGDRVQLGAVVHNNTSQSLDVTVELQATGVTLEDAADASKVVRVEPGGRQRVNWWVHAQDAGTAELVFSARSGVLQDSATPQSGSLPILHYVSPQTFATSGMMPEAGENLEVVSLPRSYEATGGELRIEMSSTLAGAVLSGLDALESYPVDLTEPVISHLLANLAAYDLAKARGAGTPDLTDRLQQAIHQDLERLPRLQNSDGGFGWAKGSQSDLYLSSYALLSLVLADEAGFMLPSGLKETTRNKIAADLYPVRDALEDWKLDRLALVLYALDRSGYKEGESAALFEQRERLSPWAKALLALTFESRGLEGAKTIFSDLAGLAIRSATGVNWQDTEAAWQNFSTPNFTTAVVVFVLAERDPASPLLADAVRYLTSHRQTSGGWTSSYDSAWVMLALTRFLHATNELNGSFDFLATLNGDPLASGSAGDENWSVVHASAPLDDLNANTGNALRFVHSEGAGRLYYRAYLEVGQPVDQVQPLERGLAVSREYILAGADCSPQDCPAVDAVNLAASNPVVIGRVTITAPTDLYYVVVEDAIPAGAEIINLRLNTSAWVPEQPLIPEVDALDPFADGWGWWWFGSPAITDQNIRWIASYLPAGTYTLTYKLQPLQAGEFRVLPARAYTYYFPEVEGRSAGAIFKIEE